MKLGKKEEEEEMCIHGDVDVNVLQFVYMCVPVVPNVYIYDLDEELMCRFS